MSRQKRHLFLTKVRVNEAEFDQIEQLAEESGLSISALIREHLLKKEVMNRDDERQKLVALNRINRDLNMIAKHANTYQRGADAIMIIQLLSEIKEGIWEGDYLK